MDKVYFPLKWMIVADRKALEKLLQGSEEWVRLSHSLAIAEINYSFQLGKFLEAHNLVESWLANQCYF